jgi:murein DD-endopeptidase MepM/ murein hydrolase activator NlpD
MAIHLGDLQARMLRLDGLGERLAQLAGLKPNELPSLQSGQVPGRGGAESPLPSRALHRRIHRVAREADLASRAALGPAGVLETLLMQDSLKRRLLPTLAPIIDGWFSSNFGYRIDPFTGLQSFHEGIDFPPMPAPPSSPQPVAAWLPRKRRILQYGKMLEIDHGNGLISRYAHASQLFVKEGDFVVRGQRVAAVGSTGRSTGPHLHFEVRQNGIPQNPARFLQSSN